MLNFYRLLLYLGLTLALLPVQIVAILLNLGLASRLPAFYHRQVCRIFGMKITIRGKVSAAKPTMFVANHISYIDISVLGGVVPASFVAKADIADWPVFGFLAKLQRTIFIDRQVRNSARQRDSLIDRMTDGVSIVMFPEGTSGDGTHLLPFKSSLFSAAAIEVAGNPIAVQPVSVVYARLNGMPLGRDFRPFVAWYGDMSLMPHMWQLLGLGHLDVIVQFHEPVSLPRFGSRKKLAQYCEQVIADGLVAANGLQH